MVALAAGTSGKGDGSPVAEGGSKLSETTSVADWLGTNEILKRNTAFITAVETEFGLTLAELLRVSETDLDGALRGGSRTQPIGTVEVLKEALPAVALQFGRTWPPPT